MTDCKTITVLNKKGGVGKTTTVTSLAYALARSGHGVLVVDLDPQGHCTPFFTDERPALTLHDSFLSPKTDCRMHICDGIDLMPASPEMRLLERELASRMNREAILSRILGAVDAARSYDAILIDSSPFLGILAENALAVSDALIVPVVPEYLSLEGFLDLEDELEQLGSGPGVTGIVLTKCDARTKSGREISQSFRQVYEDTVFRTEIHSCIKLADAPRYHRSVFEYAPDCAGTREYAALAEELVERTGITRNVRR